MYPIYFVLFVLFEIKIAPARLRRWRKIYEIIPTPYPDNPRSAIIYEIYRIS